MSFFDKMNAGSAPGAKSTKKSGTDRHRAHWVEKYRPRTVDDVAQQDEVVRTLKRSLETGNLPHLLFYGPPGTGKTTTILAIARQLFGPEILRQRVLELNASDERGIGIVRGKIKDFAQVTATAKNPGYPCPPYKIIILDEADSMTAAAQSALRRTMENYSNVTRFCLICNYVSRIIDPVASRCAKFRFKALSSEMVINRLQFISEAEKFKVTRESCETIAKVSGGDMRKAITFLQSAHTLHGDDISTEDVYDIAGVMPMEKIYELINVCKSNNFAEMEKVVKDITRQGYSATLVIDQLLDAIVESNLGDLQKSAISFRLSECDRALADGSDEWLQLLALASSMMKSLSKVK